MDRKVLYPSFEGVTGLPAKENIDYDPSDLQEDDYNYYFNIPPYGKEKECKDCHQIKPVKQFYTYKTTGRLYGSCMECTNKRVRNNYFNVKKTPGYRAKKRAYMAHYRKGKR